MSEAEEIGTGIRKTNTNSTITSNSKKNKKNKK
jgi:hypothetical protein